jgi:hypothetical protein
MTSRWSASGERSSSSSDSLADTAAGSAIRGIPAAVCDHRRHGVTFTVAALPDGAYTCPGNDQVAYTVHLDDAIGDRALLDEVCLEGEATHTSFCTDGPVRWQP